MTAPTTTDTVTLTMPAPFAVEVRKVLKEGYSCLRHDIHELPDWHLHMVRLIEDLDGQLKAGVHRG